MKYFSLFFILLISCDNRIENDINCFILENNISIVNLSKVTIDNRSVLQNFDQFFLEKYGFVYSKSNNIDFDIAKIKFVKNNGKKTTKISKPIFSIDKRYCLIQIIIYDIDLIPTDVIYLLEKDGKKWLLRNEFRTETFF